MSIPVDPPPQLLNQMGSMLRAGRFVELETMAGKLIVQYPRSGLAWELLGLSLQNQGKSALQAFRQVVKFRPADAEAWFNLGLAQQEGGHLDEAAGSYRQAIRFKPGYVAAYNNLGNALRDLGRFGEAADSIRQAVRIDPASPVLHNNLGNIHRSAGQPAEAMACFRRALELDPGFVEASVSLGNTLYETGKIDEAMAHFRHALRTNPNAPALQESLGRILMDCGQLDDAMKCFRAALEADPRYLDAWIDISQLHLIEGRQHEAESSIEKAIGIDPNDPVVYFIQGRSIKTSRDDRYFSKLLALEEEVRSGKRAMPWTRRIYLHYALGKCFDDLGEYERAFAHFQEGNRLKRASISYDAAGMSRYFDEVIRVFDRATMARLSGHGDPSDVPVFVLGMPRSGTTLVEQIIASHPEAYGAGELADLLNLSRRRIAGQGFPENMLALDHDTLARWGGEYVAGLRRHAPDARRIINKMPDNFHVIGLIHAMLPHAKIIHVMRDPVDTCLSCYMTLFNGAMSHTYDLAELGRYYADYLRLMEHWRTVLPAGAFLDVRYEDVVADQEMQARRIIDYCGLEWNDACLDFHKTKRSVGTASLAQVRQPIYRTSVQRWRSYENFLGPLLDALGRNVQR